MTDPRQWLQETRKLDNALLDHMGVKVVDHPSLGSAVAFPYQRGGESYAAKFRTIDKRFLSTKGKSRGLYNEDVLKQHEDQPIIITEGEIDCLSVIQAGFDRSVSVPDGWAEQGNKLEALHDAKAALESAPAVIVAGDNDKTGESLPYAVASLLSGRDVRYVQWPDGSKDANDVLVAMGEGELAACINRAVRIDPPGGLITNFSDLPPLPDRRVLRLGVSDFDYAVAFECGAMSVFTGVPGSGKSTFLTWAAEKVSLNENIRVGILAFETHPHTLRDQVSRIRTGKSFKHLDDDMRQRLLTNIDERFRIVNQVLDDDTPRALGWLRDVIHTLALRDGCKLIIVDPWNELEHLPEPNESLTNYINFAVKSIRQWAQRLNVHIVLVAHPKKIYSESGKPRPPTGYDVADSAAFFNKPALGVTVHQSTDEDGQDYVRLITWKVRETLLYGFEKGNMRCVFDAGRQSYSPYRKQPESEAA